MFRNHFFGFIRPSFKAATFLLLAVFLHPLMATASEQKEICEQATTVPLNTTLRSHGDGVRTDQFFKLEVPLAGLVTLEVAVPGFAEVEAKVGGLRHTCGEPLPLTAPSPWIERTATRLVLRAWTPTTYIVRVAAQDPWSPLGRYKLTTRFVPEEGMERSTSSSSAAPEEESDDELELEPNGLTLETELSLKSQGLCHGGEFDDHGDTFSCATALRPGDKVKGELRNSWGDDEDVFSFLLTEPQTIDLTSSGSTDTFGTLYDQGGHRLATDDDGGRRNQFRIVKTLNPGLYSVRIEGSHGAEGDYTLIYRASSW